MKCHKEQPVLKDSSCSTQSVAHRLAGRALSAASPQKDKDLSQECKPTTSLTTVKFSGQDFLSEGSTTPICIIHKVCGSALRLIAIHYPSFAMIRSHVSSAQKVIVFISFVCFLVLGRFVSQGPSWKQDLKWAAGLSEPARDSEGPRAINSGEQLLITTPRLKSRGKEALLFLVSARAIREGTHGLELWLQGKERSHRQQQTSRQGAGKEMSLTFSTTLQGSLRDHRRWTVAQL